MSTTSKIVLVGSCAVSLSIIIYVHFKQQYDRDQLHLGVERDLERQKRRQIENLFLLQKQRSLTKELQRESINNGETT